MNILHKFLLYCSGSDTDILSDSPTDINKHIGIGGVVFFTGLMASISAGYALFTIFDSIWASVGFGLIWGLMIFNLDRYIVSTMRKSGSLISQIGMALPRIILAGVLGIVISKPLEMKIFEKEINKQLNIIISRNKAKLQADIKARFDSKNQIFYAERDSLLSRANALKQEYLNASIELEKEIVGTQTNTTTGKKGYGTNAKRKEILKTQAKTAYDEFLNSNKSKLDSFDSKILSENEEFNQELIENSVIEDKYNGLAARMQALSELSTEYKAIGIASLFITLLFVFMEMSPVIVKLISNKGPYDYLLKQREDLFKWDKLDSPEAEDYINKTRLEFLKQYIDKIKSTFIKK